MSITIPNPPGIGAVYFLPAIAGVTADPPVGPSVAEMAAGTALSCALYGWPTTVDQTTSTSAKYCDAQPRQRLGKASYSAGPIVYDYDPQGADVGGNYAHYDALTPGLTGFMVDRRGIGSMEAPAAGQVVDIWPVKLGAIKRVDIDPTNTDGESLRTEQIVSVTGEVLFDKAITA